MKIGDLLSVPSMLLHGKNYAYGEAIAHFAPFSVHRWAVVLRDGRRKMNRNEVMIGEFTSPLSIPMWGERDGHVLDRLGCVDLDSIKVHGDRVTIRDIYKHVQKWLKTEQIMLELYREPHNDPPHLKILWRDEATRAAIRYRIVSEGFQIFRATFSTELIGIESHNIAKEKSGRRRRLRRYLRVQRIMYRILVRKPRGKASNRSSTSLSHRAGIVDQSELIQQYSEAIRRYLDEENAHLGCQTLDDPDWLDRYAGNDEPASKEWTIADYSEAIRLNPSEAQAYYCRGAAYFDLQQLDLAITDFNAVIGLNPDDARAHYCRALCYFGQGRIEQASIDLDAAITLNPSDALALYRRADHYLGLGKRTEAAADIEAAMRLTPHDAVAYYCSGISSCYRAQYEKAVAQFDAVLNLRPDDTRAYFYRGMCHSRLKQYAQAINDFDEMIRRIPDDAVAFRNCGSVHFDLGLYEDALADYAEAIRLMPDDPEAYRDRGVEYCNLQQYTQAIADFDEAIRLDPRHADAYYDRAYAHMKIGQFERGLHDFDALILLKPNDAIAYRHRAVAYRILNQRDRARADFKMAKILAPY